MNYKKLRDDTLRVVFREVYNRKYLGLDYESPDLAIKYLVDDSLLDIILKDMNAKLSSEIFSTDIETLKHPYLTINDYANLYAIYRIMAGKYQSPFARDMQTMLAIILTNKMIDNNKLGEVTLDTYTESVLTLKKKH